MTSKKCNCCDDKVCNIAMVDGNEHHSHENVSLNNYILFFCFFLYFLFLTLDIFDFLPNPYNNTLFTLLYLLSGFSVLKSAITSIYNKQFFNEFTLMSVATVVALIIGQMPEAVGVMLFYKLGELLQDMATEKSKRSIKELLVSKPNFANLIIDKTIKEIDVNNIEIGQIFLVNLGDKLPTDSVVVSGVSQIDTSSLTGEFVPQDVSAGDEVLGGCINIGSPLVVKSIRKFKDTSIARTIDVLENSVEHKSESEKFISKFAKYYTPTVFFVAFMVAVIPPLIFNQAWNEWIYKGLVMLVISCPCALVISIPLSYFAGIGIASRKGVLVKGGTVIDKARNIDIVVFDKTGTLTKGELSIQSIYSSSCSNKEEVLSIARYIEQYSNHPIAKAITKNHNFTNVDNTNNIKEIAGKGFIIDSNGVLYIAGNETILKENNIKIDIVEEVGIKVYVAVNQEYKGCIVLNDTIKNEAFSTISELKKASIKTFMLTGDNEITADFVAKKIGLDGYKSDLLPDEKMAELKKMKKEQRVMFVGDGVNDALVISTSDVGVSMGGLGSKLAIEVSDVVILNDNIDRIPFFIRLANRTYTIVWQNIIMALGVKTLFMLLGVFGTSGLWEAVFADVGVSLLAILNSLRLTKS